MYSSVDSALMNGSNSFVNDIRSSQCLWALYRLRIQCVSSDPLWKDKKYFNAFHLRGIIFENMYIIFINKYCG